MPTVAHIVYIQINNSNVSRFEHRSQPGQLADLGGPGIPLLWPRQHAGYGMLFFKIFYMQIIQFFIM